MSTTVYVQFPVYLTTIVLRLLSRQFHCWMESLSLLLSILILSSASEGIEEWGRSPVTCSTNNTACDDTEDSHSEVCFLFCQCTETHSCTECVSKTRGCYRTCGRNFVGKMDENVLEEIPAVGNIVDKNQTADSSFFSKRMIQILKPVSSSPIWWNLCYNDVIIVCLVPQIVLVIID